MTKNVKRIAITGGGGQIGYQLIFRLANGELLGPDQPIALHILELESSLEQLRGVIMELEDCAFPLLTEIVVGSDPLKVFKDVDYAFLIGAKPRGPGMERKDLLSENGKIFIGQGKALDQVASPDALILVVGNPANTNCLIALKNSKRLHPRQFYSMMQLDHNRARSMLSKKAHASIKDVEDVIVWGNHSSTQVPDYSHVKIHGKPAEEVIKDHKWLKENFVSDVQKRGAAVIAARGKSSAGSAAHAAIGAMRHLIFPSKEIFSTGMISDGNPYGIHDGLIFSFPCRCVGRGKIEIVKGLHWNDDVKEKIKLSEKELLEEKALVQDLLR